MPKRSDASSFLNYLKEIRFLTVSVIEHK